METQQLPPNQNATETKAQPIQASSKNNLFLVVISVLLTAMITGFAVYFWQKSASEKEITILKQKVVSLEEQISAIKEAETIPLPVAPPSSASELTTAWKTYTIGDYDLSFRYPATWEAGEGAEGCGPIFGPKAKTPFGVNPGIYPYITVCDGDSDNIESYTNFNLIERGSVDGRDFAKSSLKQIDENVNAGESIYAIVVDTRKENPKKPYNLIIYTYYHPASYREYGTDPNFSLEDFISLIDQILSTFEFTK